MSCCLSESPKCAAILAGVISLYILFPQICGCLGTNVLAQTVRLSGLVVFGTYLVKKFKHFAGYESKPHCPLKEGEEGSAEQKCCPFSMPEITKKLYIAGHQYSNQILNLLRRIVIVEKIFFSVRSVKIPFILGKLALFLGDTKFAVLAVNILIFFPILKKLWTDHKN